MFRRVLVYLDGAGAAPRVVAWVRRLLAPVRGDVRLLVVRPAVRGLIMDGRTVAYVDQREDAERASAGFALALLAERLHDAGLSATTDVRFGEPATAILAAAVDWGADAIAVARRPARGWTRWLTRDLTDDIVRRSPVPVLVVGGSRQRAA
jgi:nucleotide-binding universal stress UspA family protein